MQNDKDDDKYEGPDESEYHFTDDDGSFDTLEPDASESPQEERREAEAQPAPSKFSFLKNQSIQSKRMMISLVVFLGLIFVVYKMVAPSSQAPVTTMTPTVAMTDTPKEMPQMPPQTAAPAAAVAPPAPTVTANPPPPVAPVVAAPQTMPAAPTPEQQALAANPAAAPMATTTPPAEQMVQTTAQQPPQPQAPTTPVAAQTGNEGLPGMPSVIEVQSPSPEYAASQVQQQPQAPMTPTDLKIAEMQANSAKLIAEMQNEYTQKLSDFQTQNKNLQDQVQTLNTRIASLETQLTQLVQALSRQTQAAEQAPKPAPVEVDSQMPQAPEPRISYNVQAIIPGRAWLRNDNGDTVTVAEGDTVKNLGRVTKIDPYDGIVEINTGRKVISLSYGAGG